MEHLEHLDRKDMATFDSIYPWNLWNVWDIWLLIPGFPISGSPLPWHSRDVAFDIWLSLDVTGHFALRVTLHPTLALYYYRFLRY